MAVAYWRNVCSKIPTRMTVDVSNVGSNSDNFALIVVLGSFANKVYFVVQFIGFIYSLVCAFWIVYVGCDLFTQIKKVGKLTI